MSLTPRGKRLVAHDLKSAGDPQALLAVIRAAIVFSKKAGATRLRYTIRADHPDLERFARIYARLGADPVSIAYDIPL